MKFENFPEKTLDHHLGHELISIETDYVKSKLVITDNHKQPMGVVHGGTYASLSETVCSYGANYDQLGTFVGVNNNTDFIKSVSSGDLICEARPISKGNTYQLWECKIFNNDILCAVSKVRLQKKTKF